jgi:multidrug efflux pump subunit AcrA (membrane-fusion protein)
MKSSGSMPNMPAGGPPTGGMPQTAQTGQATQGAPAMGMGFMPGAASADPKTKTVWLKDEKMGLRPAMIKIGIDNGTNIEILSGLKEGDEVVVSTGDAASKAKTSTTQGPRGPFPF